MAGLRCLVCSLGFKGRCPQTIPCVVCAGIIHRACLPGKEVTPSQFVLLKKMKESILFTCRSCEIVVSNKRKIAEPVNTNSSKRMRVDTLAVNSPIQPVRPLLLQLVGSSVTLDISPIERPENYNLNLVNQLVTSSPVDNIVFGQMQMPTFHLGSNSTRLPSPINCEQTLTNLAPVQSIGAVSMVALTFIVTTPLVSPLCGIEQMPSLNVPSYHVSDGSTRYEVPIPTEEQSVVLPQNSPDHMLNANSVPIPESRLQTSVSDSVPITWTVLDSALRKGTKSLFDSRNHKYTVKRNNKNGSVMWRCTVRGGKNWCRATVLQIGSQFKFGPQQHICKPKKNVALHAKIVSEAKKDARTNKFCRVQKIVEPIFLKYFEEDREQDLPVMSGVSRCVYRMLEGMRPQNPKDIDFDISNYTDVIPTGFLKEDIIIRSRDEKMAARHLVFATDQQIETLRNAKRIFADGTFRVVPKPFYQLFSLHVFVKTNGLIKQVPVLFVLMSRRQTKDYRKVFKSILKIKLQSDDPEVEAPLNNFKEFVCDFERAVWKVVGELFPSVTIKECAFHLTQAFFRNIQKIGLASSYFKDKNTRVVCRQLMALNLLPHEKIPKRFNAIKENCTGLLLKFCLYIERNWITGNMWPPSVWSVFMQHHRTNNDAEGWHNKLNWGHIGPVNLFKLIANLWHEARLIPLQSKLLSQGQVLRKQSRIAKSMQSKLIEIWDKYNSCEISSRETLEQCAILYFENNKLRFNEMRDEENIESD